MLRHVVLLVAFAAVGPALAQEPTASVDKAPSAAQAAQRERMTSCNKDAGGKNLAGDARKGFMKDCLAGKAPESEKKLTPQQAKMGACNKDATAKGLKGKERTSFMSSCLKA